jgi:hypothetical protein
VRRIPIDEITSATQQRLRGLLEHSRIGWNR